jgi:hypothetical protein
MKFAMGLATVAVHESLFCLLSRPHYCLANLFGFLTISADWTMFQGLASRLGVPLRVAATEWRSGGYALFAPLSTVSFFCDDRKR